VWSRLIHDELLSLFFTFSILGAIRVAGGIQGKRVLRIKEKLIKNMRGNSSKKGHDSTPHSPKNYS